LIIIRGSLRVRTYCRRKFWKESVEKPLERLGGLTAKSEKGGRKPMVERGLRVAPELIVEALNIEGGEVKKLDKRKDGPTRADKRCQDRGGARAILSSSCKAAASHPPSGDRPCPGWTQSRRISWELLLWKGQSPLLF